jgi:hypothetical protein
MVDGFQGNELEEVPREFQNRTSSQAAKAYLNIQNILQRRVV